jgi:hypothetical protein
VGQTLAMVAVEAFIKALPCGSAEDKAALRRLVPDALVPAFKEHLAATRSLGAVSSGPLGALFASSASERWDGLCADELPAPAARTWTTVAAATARDAASRLRPSPALRATAEPTFELRERAQGVPAVLAAEQWVDVAMADLPGLPPDERASAVRRLRALADRILAFSSLGERERGGCF